MSASVVSAVLLSPMTVISPVREVTFCEILLLSWETATSTSAMEKAEVARWRALAGGWLVR